MDILARRSAGILLHPTSLPGPFGIGDLGPQARRFLDLLAGADQSWWQILPLNPPGDGDSPYQCYSAFAGNTLLLSPEDLLADGLLSRDSLRHPRDTHPHRIHFPSVTALKHRLLEEAWQRFSAGQAPHLRPGLDAFIRSNDAWLPDYALFTALRQAHPDTPWPQWPRALARRQPRALRAARSQFRAAIERETFAQFLFHRQMRALRDYALSRGIRILGDLPIFVSADSADTWTRPELFALAPSGKPTYIAGCPPDAFCATGQLWGNPMYDWDAMRADRFRWWIDRFRRSFVYADALRIDHFRGFAAAWSIRLPARDASRGRWVRGPGFTLFHALERRLGPLPLIAEDLGVITPDVEKLRDRLGLPGMRVLQFAFDDDPNNPHLPHNHPPASVAYTGTHDNTTTVDWYHHLTPEQKLRLSNLQPDAHRHPARALMRLAWLSPARIAIAPLQDLFEFDARSRMNTPGTSSGNWKWRWTPAARNVAVFHWLRELTRASGRAPQPR